MGWFDHYSTIMIITGLLHMGLLGVRSARLPEYNFVKKHGENIVSGALFPAGILQFIASILYVWEVFTGTRGPALILPPEYAAYGLPATALFAGSMVLGSVSATGQIGRKVPWAVLSGGATAAIGGAGVWSLASGVGLSGAPVYGGAGLIALVLFVAMFFITLPGEAVIKTVGNVSAFSPVVLINSSLMIVLGALTGMGLVIL
jgi:hypothetical protein